MPDDPIFESITAGAVGVTVDTPLLVGEVDETSIKPMTAAEREQFRPLRQR